MINNFLQSAVIATDGRSDISAQVDGDTIILGQRQSSCEVRDACSGCSACDESIAFTAKSAVVLIKVLQIFLGDDPGALEE